MKIDLHLHSEYSWDSKTPISQYIKKAEKLDYGAISITDHNSIQSHKEIQELQKTTDVLLIPGQEVSTSDGHLLVYGWVDNLPQSISMEETVKLAHKQSGICIAAHPFDFLRNGSKSKIFSTGIDGLEVINASSWLERFNQMAQNAAKTYPDLIKLGNSDSHHISEFGFAWSNIPNIDQIEEVLPALKNAIPNGKRIGIYRKIKRIIRRKFG